MPLPCSSDPQKWFWYDIVGNNTEEQQKRRGAILDARRICLSQCPLQARRQCARMALEDHEEYGIWAGIILPGSQYRHGSERDKAWAALEAIAAGDYAPMNTPLLRITAADRGKQKDKAS